MNLPEATGKKTRALIVEGGGMRGSFAGGVLASMSRIYPPSNFDIVVGVSSGSCSAAYYVASTPTERMVDWCLDVWRYELTGSRFISYLNMLRGKTILNQEYLIDFLFGKKYEFPRHRLDDPKRTPFYVTLSNLQTILPEYVRATSQNVLHLLKAATSLPIATRGRKFLGESEYTDGGVIDPMPVEAVMEAGYKDITVVLNHPRSYRSDPVGKMLGWLSYPGNKKIREFITREHHHRFNRAFDLLNHPPAGFNIQIVDPKSPVPAGLVTRDIVKLNRAVDLGIETGLRYFSERVSESRSKFSSKLKAFFKR
ncbi:MAG: patatin-like phospholipase family protein [Spirochaetia bacterium]|nr:patatin-like phospholipase family protein [Spirochaetia bacterium]